MKFIATRQRQVYILEYVLEYLIDERWCEIDNYNYQLSAYFYINFNQHDSQYIQWHEAEAGSNNIPRWAKATPFGGLWV